MTNTYRLNIYSEIRTLKSDSKKLETAMKNFDAYKGLEGVLKIEVIDRVTGKVLASWSK